jgi:pyruvate dehydrogenase complex dehydrogenase (E1) component
MPATEILSQEEVADYVAPPPVEDHDPGETAEWLEALEAVIQHGGTDRARYLLTQLQEKALRNGETTQN